VSEEAGVHTRLGRGSVIGVLPSLVAEIRCTKVRNEVGKSRGMGK